MKLKNRKKVGISLPDMAQGVEYLFKFVRFDKNVVPEYRPGKDTEYAVLEDIESGSLVAFPHHGVLTPLKRAEKEISEPNMAISITLEERTTIENADGTNRPFIKYQVFYGEIDTETDSETDSETDFETNTEPDTETDTDIPSDFSEPSGLSFLGKNK